LGFRQLKVYQLGLQQASTIFDLSIRFPKEERYSMTDQIRRSSRSVLTNIAEGYRKRQYSRHFCSKMSDADAENSETLVWLELALTCNYLDDPSFMICEEANRQIGHLLGFMINNPGRFK
jgi:four helix bundle protein